MWQPKVWNKMDIDNDSAVNDCSVLALSTRTFDQPKALRMVPPRPEDPDKHGWNDVTFPTADSVLRQQPKSLHEALGGSGLGPTSWASSKDWCSLLLPSPSILLCSGFPLSPIWALRIHGLTNSYPSSVLAEHLPWSPRLSDNLITLFLPHPTTLGPWIELVNYLCKYVFHVTRETGVTRPVSQREPVHRGPRQGRMALDFMFRVGGTCRRVLSRGGDTPNYASERSLGNSDGEGSGFQTFSSWVYI